MADYDRRRSGGGGGGGGGFNRKRRFRDDDEYDNREYQRRRHDRPQPPSAKIRKSLLSLAESPLRRWHEEVQSVAHIVAENAEDAEFRESFLALVQQLAVEQPLKTPYVAAVVLVVNSLKPEITAELLNQLAAAIERRVEDGLWRDAKLYLKLLGCLQGCLAGNGVFPVLEDLFGRAVDLQTASSDDTIGTEVVKIILLTIPYIMSATSGEFQQQAAELMDKTDIIASEPHPLQALIDPYISEDGSQPAGTPSVIGLLQKQLQQEAANNWTLECLPRPWKMPLEEVETQERLDSATKHELPTITIPAKVVRGPRPLFPEVYFSVYGNQEIESVPPTTHIASTLIRDAIVDTINILDYNRNATARFLVDVDCYFSDTTFIKRATPFDRLRDVEPGRSTWKPEDVVVDAVFSQLHQLPVPEHKLVYYHSVLTETCKQAPAAVAPSLGRAIRHLYRETSRMDLELNQRFLDWFAHHLSNFGFTWKWTEWVNDVFLSEIHPNKAFIIGALDKEIRLSFAQRIKNTLPPEYQALIGPEKEKDVPDFKFSDDSVPFAAEGRDIASLLKRKAADEDFQPVFDRIHQSAADLALDPVVASTDVFVTAVCWVGSKSLSHVLACIERVKEKLLDMGAQSDATCAQIITSVMVFWQAQPGVAVSIIEKLLNYTILTPVSVVQWALVDNQPGARPGDALSQAHIYELVSNTVNKVIGRVRQVIAPGSGADADMKTQDIKAMRDLFKFIEDTLASWASGSKDELLESSDGDGDRGLLLRQWGGRWLRVFRRRAAIEEAFIAESRSSGDADTVMNNGA